MHEPTEEYAGTAFVSLDGEDVPVEVHLRGAFEPIDGHFHWRGRVATDLDVPNGTAVQLTTEHGSATGTLSDLDPWGRYKITGVGRPPF